ncbi:MAG: DUF4417 domain-containing protein [Lachnospiraceae bacterium]|nr:DUF4417 domain-containing protein [Lachnospiraceae bacterium]
MPVYSNLEYVKIVRPLPKFVQRDICGIPVIEPNPLDISAINNGLWLINMKNASVKDRCPERKIVHSFCYDDVLWRAYNNPYRYLERVAPYYAVASFDFSMDIDMDYKQVYDAVYINRWSGAFIQANGKNAIPTVGWLKPDSYDLCLAGIRDGGVFLISTLGANNSDSYPDFIAGYREVRRRFPKTQIICVGNRLIGMDDDVCYVRYEESFGSQDRYQDWWQPKLINWDMSIPKGV